MGRGFNPHGPDPKENPSRDRIWPNPAKLSQARPKESKGINFDFLVRIEPFQGLAPTPQGIFLSHALAPTDSPESWPCAAQRRPVSIALGGPGPFAKSGGGSFCRGFLRP
jgi:hypothetical protein